MFEKITHAIVLIPFVLPTFSFAGVNEDTLKNLYDTGTAPASPTDFPERNYSDGSFVQPQVMNCAIVDGTDQPFGYNVARTIRITPPYGPVIPGKQDEKLTFGDIQSSYNLIVDPVIDNLDLVVANPIYRTWIDNLGVNHAVPATLRARKSGDYVAFQVSVLYHNSAIQDQVFYGYCYRTGKALLTSVWSALQP